MQLERPRASTSTLPDSRARQLGPAPLPPDFSDIWREAGSQQRVDDGVRDALDTPVAGQWQDASPARSPDEELQHQIGQTHEDDRNQEVLASLDAAEVTFSDALEAWLRGSGIELHPVVPPSTSIPSGDQQEQSCPRLLTSLRSACQQILDAAGRKDAEMLEAPVLSMEDGSFQEIRARVEFLAAHSACSVINGRIARNLASMLGCITRLRSLYIDLNNLQKSPIVGSSNATTFNGSLAVPLTNQHSPSTSFPTEPLVSASVSPKARSPASSAPMTPSSSHDVYQTLHRQAKAYQVTALSSRLLARTGSYDSTNAVRAVEEAEIELLWSKVDELLEVHQALSAEVDGAFGRSGYAGLSNNEDWMAGATPALLADENAFSHQQLPEYSSLDPPEYGYEGEESPSEKRTSLDEQESRRQRRSSDRTRISIDGHNRQAGPSDEKMQLDFDKMTGAIERLYATSPQLANQRVDRLPMRNPVDRDRMREAQLARLGTAIERLSKGRMEDQRASAALLAPHQSTEHADQETGKSALESAARRKQQSLNLLLETIDKAASRTLSDQRVAMSPRQRAVLSGARTTVAQVVEAESDSALLGSRGKGGPAKEELEFRELLMDSVGKGRYTGQDASFTPNGHGATINGMNKRKSLAHILDPVDASEGVASDMTRTRSASLSCVPPIRSSPVPRGNTLTPTSATSASANQSLQTLKKRFSVTRLLASSAALASEKKDTMSVPPIPARKLSKSSSGSAVSTPTGSRPASLFGDYFIEKTKSREAEISTSAQSAGSVQYVVEEMRNLGSLVVRAWDDSSADSPKSPTPWSATSRNASTLLLHTGSDVLETASPDGVPVKLVNDASTSTSQTHSFTYKNDHHELRLPTSESGRPTRSREDLEIAIPYCASDLRRHKPTSLQCTNCKCTLADLTSILRYNDLPSEHWAELLDAWMCHEDQTLSKELMEKGNNIWPKETQALIGSNDFVLANSVTRGWELAKGAEPFEGPDGKWWIIICSVCRAAVGKGSSGPSSMETDDDIGFLKLAKYAVRPSGMPAHSLSSHVTSTMLETSLSRAVHRFVIEDQEEGIPRAVLWLFNPHMRIFSSHPSFVHSDPVNAVKVLYSARSNMNESVIDDILGKAEYETLIYPSRVCTQLGELLACSTRIYPESQQKLGEWSVGWLERSIRAS